MIDPAARKAGYAKPQRADQISAPGIITQQVIQAIADADLVIADLTEHNPNVFYELAIRHGLQKPLVQLLESPEPLPFDISQMRTIKFDIHDIDSAVRAREELTEQINQLKDADSPLVTPISVTRDIKAMWESEDPVTHALADVLAAISSLKAETQTQQRTINVGTASNLRIGQGALTLGSPFTQPASTFSPSLGATGPFISLQEGFNYETGGAESDVVTKRPGHPPKQTQRKRSKRSKSEDV